MRNAAHKRQTIIKQLLLLQRGLRQKSLIIVKQANSRRTRTGRHTGNRCYPASLPAATTITEK